MAKVEGKVKEVITAVYKVNLHCPQCASEIKRPLLRTPGVHEVETNMERNEIKVKGRIDAQRIREGIRKLIKREVDIVAPTQGKVKEAIISSTEKVTVKETKTETQEKAKDVTTTGRATIKETKEKLHTTTLKVHLHCDKCGRDLRNNLIKRKGIYDVKTDMKAQTLTVEGIVEPNKVLAFIQKKVHKHAEIIVPKAKEKEEKKEHLKVEAKSLPEGAKEKAAAATIFTEEKKITEIFKEKEAGLKNKDGSIPYFVHYVYAPQLFSDENPNACSVM